MELKAVSQFELGDGLANQRRRHMKRQTPATVPTYSPMVLLLAKAKPTSEPKAPSATMPVIQITKTRIDYPSVPQETCWVSLFRAP